MTAVSVLVLDTLLVLWEVDPRVSGMLIKLEWWWSLAATFVRGYKRDRSLEELER